MVINGVITCYNPCKLAENTWVFLGQNFTPEICGVKWAIFPTFLTKVTFGVHLGWKEMT